MYVMRNEQIRVSTGGSSFTTKLGSTVGTAVGNKADEFIPADRTVFSTEDATGGGYDVAAVLWISGATNDPENLFEGHTEGASIQQFYTLGFMGKSGRFVGISNRTRRHG